MRLTRMVMVSSPSMSLFGSLQSRILSYEFSFSDFIIRDINDDNLENDIREAFRCFDKDALGYIPVPSKTKFSYKDD